MGFIKNQQAEIDKVRSNVRKEAKASGKKLTRQEEAREVAKRINRGGWIR